MASHALQFKQADSSDCTLVVRLTATGHSEGNEPAAKRSKATATCNSDLATFPAHKAVLLRSDYFKIQAIEWQVQATAHSRTDDEARQSCQPVFTLSITSEEQLPVAEAIVAAMYGLETAVPSLLQHQLVHAAVISDMLGATEAVQQAVSCLNTAILSEEGLSAVAQETLAGLHAWPVCLQKLLPAMAASAGCCKLTSDDLDDILDADDDKVLQRMLLSVFGDLQAVWRHKQLEKLLLKLPLPAMQLLLSSNELQVPSEDVVMYTAQRYTTAQEHNFGGYSSSDEDADSQGDTSSDTEEERAKAASKKAAKVLSQLIRAPYLSDFALQHAALGANSKYLLLGELLPQLRQLITLRRCARVQKLYNPVSYIPQVPASWLEDQRQSAPADTAPLTWELPVEKLAWLCRCVAKCKHTNCMSLYSDTGIHRGGLRWGLELRCRAEDGATQVGLYLRPCTVPDGIFYSVILSCSGNGYCRLGEWECFTGTSSDPGKDGGFSDFWQVGRMAGGWDEAVMTAHGLHGSGKLVVEVLDVQIT